MIMDIMCREVEKFISIEFYELVFLIAINIVFYLENQELILSFI